MASLLTSRAIWQINLANFIAEGGPLTLEPVRTIYASFAGITPVALLLSHPWLLQDKSQDANT